MFPSCTLLFTQRPDGTRYQGKIACGYTNTQSPISVTRKVRDLNQVNINDFILTLTNLCFNS